MTLELVIHIMLYCWIGAKPVYEAEVGPPLHPDVALLAPARAPAVLHQPVVGAGGVRAVADGEHGVVRQGVLARAREQPARVVVPPAGVHRHTHGALQMQVRVLRLVSQYSTGSSRLNGKL